VISTPLLLGYIGLINVVILSPVLALMVSYGCRSVALFCPTSLPTVRISSSQNWSGLESLSNLTWAATGAMCLSGLLNNVVSDYLWARSVLLTSSTVATVGLSITIPIAMVADFVVKNESPTVLSATGAGLVVVGFCLVNLGIDTEMEFLTSLLGKSYRRIPDLPQ
jgi:drug/metabolite transporter (DMT)-like permease